MAICDDSNILIKKKVEEIDAIIKLADPDKYLKKLIEQQFQSILEEEEILLSKEKNFANAASIRKEKEEFIKAVDSFKRWAVKRISKYKSASSQKVALTKLHFDQMNAAQIKHEASESDGQDLFIPTVTNGSNSSPEVDASFSGKRVRKQVVRPDFVITFKKPKIDKENKMEDRASSSMEGEHTPVQCNGRTGQEFPCPVCRKIFRKKGHMTRHLLTHEPEKPFGCDFCPKRFAAKYSLQMHLLNRHNTDAKPFECETCDRRFTLKKELDQHVQTHKEGFKPKSFPCTNCDLKFITQGDLDSHLEMTHPEDSFNCRSCEKTFPRRYNLIRHERTHSTEKLYHCSVCEKEFGTKNGLQMHLQAHELETKVKSLTCHICEKQFAVEQNLDIHISFHNNSEEKPYSCNLCEVRFKTKERLEKHIETHGSSEGRVYHCQYCEKMFPRKYNLIRHELSHTHGRRKPKDGLPTPIPRVLEERERVVKDKDHFINGNFSQSNSTSNSKSNGGTIVFVKNENDTISVALNNSTTASVRYIEEDSTITPNATQVTTQTNNCYSYVYSTASKSDLYSTLFGLGEDNHHYDGISPPFSRKTYQVLKFENY